MVRDVLSRGWALDVDRLEYAAVGFGSHHWRAFAEATQYFITVDDLDTKLRDHSDSRPAALERLEAALIFAADLQSSGCGFAVGPTRGIREQATESLDERFVCALYPHVAGESGTFGGYEHATERTAVADVLAALHAQPRRQASTLLVDDHSIPSRDELVNALHDLDSEWSTGPFAASTRARLAQHREELAVALEAYDRFVESETVRGAARVPTHGEPHRGNVIMTPEGPALIDWDTALVAPPERDLWSLVLEDESVRGHYESTSKRTLDDQLLALYQLWWDLCEVALFVADFRRPHTLTADTEAAWAGLQTHLDPDRWDNLISLLHRR